MIISACTICSLSSFKFAYILTSNISQLSNYCLLWNDPTPIKIENTYINTTRTRWRHTHVHKLIHTQVNQPKERIQNSNLPMRITHDLTPGPLDICIFFSFLKFNMGPAIISWYKRVNSELFLVLTQPQFARDAEKCTFGINHAETPEDWPFLM
jgi:hypothetical protein